MKLCLVRHGIAGERGAAYPDDSQRPLTEKGRARMHVAAMGLRKLVKPDAFLTSPLVRARETAEILLDVYGVKKLHVSDALANGNHEALFADANALGCEVVVAVGHEPFISQTLALALTGNEAGLVATFKKGAAALLTFDGPATPGKGMLEWLIQPAGLRAIGGSGDRDLGSD